MNELVQLLTTYLMGTRSLPDCAEWLAGIDWDDPDLTEEEQNSLGEFELLITEITEGLRQEAELWQAAATVVAAYTGNVYGKWSFDSVRIISGTTMSPISLSQSVIPVVPESQPWNISPLMAPSS